VPEDALSAYLRDGKSLTAYDKASLYPA